MITSLNYVLKGGQFEENIKEISGQIIGACGKNCEIGVMMSEGGKQWGMKYCHFLHLGRYDATLPPTPTSFPA